VRRLESVEHKGCNEIIVGRHGWEVLPEDMVGTSNIYVTERVQLIDDVPGRQHPVKQTSQNASVIAARSDGPLTYVAFPDKQISWHLS
jgi:hypothetical protein